MMVDIDPEDAITRRADDRGRVSLRPEYANKEVEIVIVDIEDGDG